MKGTDVGGGGARPAILAEQVAASIAHALEFHRRGDIASAETIYREVLSSDPGNPDALHLLGLIAHQSGQPDAAAALIVRALRRRRGR